ncbi:MAG: hypothetical protein LQ349_004106, partial [Xanthoria aureola]
PYAVKHVGAESDGHDEVFRVSHSHYISSFAARESTDCYAWSISPGHFFTAYLPQLQIQTSLYDTEEVLSVRMLVGGDTAVEPPDRAFHGFFHPGFVGGGGCDDVVELHDYVGADGVLK